MIACAELVKFIDYIIKLGAIGVENDSEFALLFLHVHHQAEERGNQVVLALVEE